MWYDKLRAGLQDRGFKATKADPCLFIGKKVICISYVDGCLWFTRKWSDIDAVLKSFQEDGDQHNWEMRVEGTVFEYLGIKVTPQSDKGYQFTQTGLIDKILDVTGMKDCSPEETPTATTGPLG